MLEENITELENKVLAIIYYSYIDWRTYSIPTQFTLVDIRDNFVKVYPNHYKNSQTAYASLRDVINQLSNKEMLELVDSVTSSYALTHSAIDYCKQNNFLQFEPSHLKEPIKNELQILA